ncbi:hypothetical protein Tph_c05380 [Thermacetogenium phaeum DSM 12270]|uniref:Uncharacterized protein n=1 Tax=Thermacetogenium phaeum (strain ATCC BAA-254 / DSM 26808 / PB) TaxID=1089553 RepID=K4LCY2_THEPS|nr:hypothetical protein [Thermacetogenium phaeum]AFV10776.1 hypothetical protein Tph_c05380 [Thermacetogenium phaeum DSM 12270]
MAEKKGVLRFRRVEGRGEIFDLFRQVAEKIRSQKSGADKSG